MTGSTRFPEGFLWGAATSAYQIEGSPLADGAGESIWHRFSHTPGKTHDGDTGDVACDHYRRYAEDVELMRGLGLGAYRFSIAWGRVLPAGRGRVNQAGLDFYERLIDGLLEAGIQPAVTLYHWDLPAALDALGGWVNPDVAGWFQDYAAVLFRAFGDRVPLWMTINEPWVIMEGYLFEVNAPGHGNLAEAPLVSHHLLRAHGLATAAYRSGGWKQRIGLVVNLEPKESATTDPRDVAACARADAYMNRHYLDPVFRGEYPAELREIFGGASPEFDPADFEAIRQPLDFLGVNYYTRKVVRHDDESLPLRVSPVPVEGALYTDTDWEVHPAGLTRTLAWVKERYGDIPLYVTENGAAFPDPEQAVGRRIEDPLRVQYLRDHLLAARDAIERGVDLRGYFVWSLLDNFEWSSGYSKRLGLYHVDYETQRRTPKASAEYYREVIRTHGASLEAAAGASARDGPGPTAGTPPWPGAHAPPPRRNARARRGVH
jgi:beta-glucosidase